MQDKIYLFLTFSVLVANPKKLLHTVASLAPRAWSAEQQKENEKRKPAVWQRTLIDVRMVITYSKTGHQLNRDGCPSCWCSAKQESLVHACEGSAVASRVSPLILHTRAGSSTITVDVNVNGASSRDSSRFQRRPPFIYTANRYRVS